MADLAVIEKRETAKAAQAFADYVALGPDRSLRKLHAAYCQRPVNEAPTRRFETLAKWSSQLHWQGRLAAAASERSQQLLAEAFEIDAESFTVTSRKLRERLDYTEPVNLDALVRIRESVRPKNAAAGSLDLNLNVSLTLKALVEQLAVQEGLDPTEVFIEAQRIATEFVA